MDPTIHRHDICLANAKAADLVILVIAGRLGAPYYADTTISATWAEFRAASQAGVPIIVCVDRRVWDERDAYRRDPTTPLKVTKDPKTFEFLSEINAAPQGYWMEIYADSAQILKRLDSLVELFPVSLHSTGQGVRRDGKYIVASSLSAEAQHHVWLVIE